MFLTVILSVAGLVVIFVDSEGYSRVCIDILFCIIIDCLPFHDDDDDDCCQLILRCL